MARASASVVGSGTVGPEPITAGSSPGTSEIASVTTRAGGRARASRPPLMRERCFRTRVDLADVGARAQQRPRHRLLVGERQARAPARSSWPTRRRRAAPAPDRPAPAPSASASVRAAAARPAASGTGWPASTIADEPGRPPIAVPRDRDARRCGPPASRGRRDSAARRPRPWSLRPCRRRARSAGRIAAAAAGAAAGNATGARPRPPCGTALPGSLRHAVPIFMSYAASTPTFIARRLRRRSRIMLPDSFAEWSGAMSACTHKIDLARSCTLGATGNNCKGGIRMAVAFTVNGTARASMSTPTRRCSGWCASTSSSPAPNSVAAPACAAPAPSMSTARRCAPARPRCRRSRARRSPPSRACRRTATIRCRRPGSPSRCRNAATASPARSCRRPNLLAKNKKPTREQIVAHMDGNICRCGTYPRIVRAIQRAAKEA